MILAVSFGVVKVPEVPLCPFERVHAVALLDVQVKSVVPLYATEVGFAEKVAVGANGGAVTVTTTLLLTVPPAPTQVAVNVVEVVSAAVVNAPPTPD